MLLLNLTIHNYNNKYIFLIFIFLYYHYIVKFNYTLIIKTIFLCFSTNFIGI